jgi:mannose-6-phosphate isomerase-like protein (cupin superfamily)
MASPEPTAPDQTGADQTAAADDVIARRPADFETFRIAPGDTNRMALFVDPVKDKVPFVGLVEIFDVGGKTPPNTHHDAHEMFYVLKGQGIATCNGRSIPVAPGNFFLVRPGHEHVVENTGDTPLYCLTIMIPNEGFAELVRSGAREPLTAADLAALTGA